MEAKVKVVTPKNPLSHRISKELLDSYLAQDNLEATFLCRDGKQLCSRQVLGSSEFFYFKTKNMAANVNDKLEFDYTNYSHASVKLYLDSLHLIKCDPVDVAVIVECIDFVQFEGKTSLFNSFERDFVAALMDSITDLPVGTELLISAYLSCVGTLDNEYQRKVIEKLAERDVGSLFYKFDLHCRTNQRLIEMCAAKKFFDDTSDDFILLTLMKYGKKLLNLRGGDLSRHGAGLELLLDTVGSEQVCTVWDRGMAGKVYLEPLNKDEMILIGDSPSIDDHSSGWGGSRRSRGFGGDDRHDFPEAKSFIINTAERSKLELVLDYQATICSAARINDSMFVTGANNGTVTIWKDKEITSMKKIFTDRALVIVENETVIAASRDQDIVELNLELDTIKIHRGTGCRQKPTAMNSNEEYLVVGYEIDYDYGDGRSSKITIKGRGQGLQVSETYENNGAIERALIESDTIFSSSAGTIHAWSLPDQTTKYEIKHGGKVLDFLVGQKRSPLANRIVMINSGKACCISNKETGGVVAKVQLDSFCRSLTVDRNETVIVVGTDDNKVNFIDATTFKIVKQVTLGSSIDSLAFNQQNDVLVAASKSGQVFSFKF